MRKIKFIPFFLFCILTLCSAACRDGNNTVPTPVAEPDPTGDWTTIIASPAAWDGQKRAGISYQLLVYSFADSDGDKCGDLKGIIDKLDYLDKMGVKAIWLSPIHPAMSYHGYDVTDYTAINPRYGTMSDFENLVTEAHHRGINIYLDYVMNHTGREHPWFIDAESSVKSEHRGYYIFSQNPEADIKAGKIAMIEKSGYNPGEWFSVRADNAVKGVYKFTLDNSSAADILFASMDFWYYHSHFHTDWFADLNYGPIDAVADSPAYKEIAAAAKGWIDRGVDGFRLDAVKHIYHSAASDENPRFLKMFYDDMNAHYKQQGKSDDIYIVGEVLSGSDEVAPYYRGLPALFEFDFWYRLEWAINNGTGCYFAKDILSYRQKYANYRQDYIEATKLSNHDEDRTASQLGKSIAKCKLAAAVLLTGPGEPYIYYGEELGVYGMKEKGDEYVRGPMLWGDHYTTSYTDKIDAMVSAAIKPVPEQGADKNSLLNTYLTFTRLRNTYPSLAEGTMSEHPKYNENNTADKAIGAWYMTKGNEKMLVIHNFGSDAKEIPLSDNVEKAVCVSGEVQEKGKDQASVRLGGYSSAVFKITPF